MFTGLVVERGRVAAALRKGDGSLRLEIAHSAALGERLPVGASLAVAGVCLTVGARRPGESSFEVAPETLARSRLGELEAGDEVNLEPPLRAGDPLGGHLVQGHVDATVGVLAVHRLGEHREVEIELPPALSPYVVEKGSVTLDGVSLTVASRGDDRFRVALVPHTLAVTTLGALRPGQRLDFEVDVLARYVEQALRGRGSLPA